MRPPFESRAGRPLAAVRFILMLVLMIGVGWPTSGLAAADADLARLAELVRQNPGEPELRWAYATSLADAGDLDAAIRELREYERRWPERRADLPFLLGRWHYERGDDVEAQKSLSRAVFSDPRSGATHLYMGLVLSRVGDAYAAADQFRMAARLEPDLAPEAGLLGGLALLSAGDDDDGLALLRQVVERYPNSEPARYARLVLGERAPDRDERFRAQIYAGMEYDSNVTLTNGDVVSEQASDQADGAGAWGADLSAGIWKNERLSFRVGTRYDGRQHIDLSDFDTHEISGYGSASWKVSPRVRLRLDGSVGWSTLGGEPYVLTGTVRPSLSVAVSERAGVLRIYGEVAPVDFDEDPIFQSLERDGVYYTGSVDHFWPVPGLDASWISFGALYSRLETDAERDLLGFESAYDHHRWRAALAFHAPLPGKFVVDLGANVSGEYYDNRNLIALLAKPTERPDDREDSFYEVGVRVARPLTRYLDLELSWRFFHRDSNVSVYSYDRHVVGLLLRLHPLRWIQEGKGS